MTRLNRFIMPLCAFMFVISIAAFATSLGGQKEICNLRPLQGTSEGPVESALDENSLGADWYHYENIQTTVDADVGCATSDCPFLVFRHVWGAKRLDVDSLSLEIRRALFLVCQYDCEVTLRGTITDNVFVVSDFMDPNGHFALRAFRFGFAHLRSCELQHVPGRGPFSTIAQTIAVKLARYVTRTQNVPQGMRPWNPGVERAPPLKG